MKGLAQISFIILGVALTPILGGCARDVSPSQPNNSNTPTPPPPPPAQQYPNCSQPSFYVLDRGVRRFDVATPAPPVRGNVSTVRVNPVTGNLGVLYHDAGCTCLWYSYELVPGLWRHEMIAPFQSTAVWFDFDYLSDGRPVVVFVNGNAAPFRLSVAIRNSNNHSQNAAWSLGEVFNGGTFGPVQISVNPLDQVAIVFNHNPTATAGDMRFAICTQNCHLVSQYSAVSPLAFISNQNNSTRQLGVGWCRASSTEYYPVIVYPTNATSPGSAYRICRQSNLNDCLTFTNWVGNTLADSLQNAFIAGLYRDPYSANDHSLVMFTRTSTGVALYNLTHCATGTTSSLTAVHTITPAALGSQWASIEFAQNRWHLVANEGNTAINYYNTSSNALTPWNGATSVSLGGSIPGNRSNIVYHPSSGKIIGAFMRGALPYINNLLLFHIENPSETTPANRLVTHRVLRHDGGILPPPPTNSVPNLALARTHDGQNVGAVAIDYSQGIILRYYFRGGQSFWESPWTSQVVTSLANPTSVDITFDQQDRPWIGFFDVNVGTNRFTLAFNSDPSGTGLWKFLTVPLPPSTTFGAATAPAHYGIKLVWDQSVSPWRLVVLMSVANGTPATANGVWMVTYPLNTQQFSTPSQILALPAAQETGHFSATNSASGGIFVAIHRRSGTASLNRVEYLQSLDGGATWSTPIPVNSMLSNLGAGLNMSFNPSSGRPELAFYDRINNRIYRSRCTTALSTCNLVTNWTTELIENLTAGVSGLPVTAEGPLSVSYTHTADGKSFLVYPIGPGHTGALHVTHNTSGVFLTPSQMVMGPFLSNIFINPGVAVNAVNFVQPGWNIRSVIDANNRLHSVFVGPRNWLYAMECAP